jgi:DNA-binding beta-propeller fold protein YncE
MIRWIVVVVVGFGCSSAMEPGMPRDAHVGPPSDADVGPSDAHVDPPTADAARDGGSVDAALDAAIARPPLTTGVSTLAGWAEAGDVDGPRDQNLFHNPVGIAIGPGGGLLVADFDNNKIRMVDPAGTASTLFAGPGFARPFALAVDGASLFVATDNDPAGGHDAMSGTLWKIDLGSHAATVIAARIGRPRGLVALHDGRLAIADYTHHVVELVELSTGQVSVLAGAWDQPGFGDATGAIARFDLPYGIALRGDGSLVVADQGNRRIRAIQPDGEVTTLAGDGSVPVAGAATSFDHPQGLAITAAGDLYITDVGSARILRLRAGLVESVAGDGVHGYRDADDPGAAEFHGLEGVAVTSDGTLVVVADGTGGEDVPFNRVRTIALSP